MQFKVMDIASPLLHLYVSWLRGTEFRQTTRWRKQPELRYSSGVGLFPLFPIRFEKMFKAVRFLVPNTFWRIRYPFQARKPSSVLSAKPFWIVYWNRLIKSWHLTKLNRLMGLPEQPSSEFYALTVNVVSPVVAGDAPPEAVVRGGEDRLFHGMLTFILIWQSLRC